jgi:dTDP-4-dehydrorhamnose 3,5-epimerase-like enzyme
VAPLLPSADLPSGCTVVELTVRGDERGSLVALEGGRDVPFEIARAYYIFGTQAGVARGFHAHRRTVQMAVVVRGSCRMLLEDGERRTWVTLDRPDRAIVIGAMVWHEMHDFSDDCVMLVLADDHYDESDYIRDHATFVRLIEGGNA